MPFYRVTIRRILRVTEEAEIELEAANPDVAEDQARFADLPYQEEDREEESSEYNIRELRP